MNWKTVSGMGVAVAAIVLVIIYHQRGLPPIPDPKPYEIVEVGLTPDESLVLHHVYQGTNLFPLAFVFALTDPETGEPMSQTFEKYGFLLEEKSENNPYRLPVGFGYQMEDIFFGIKAPMLGINCAACHTGEIHHKREDGKLVRLRIDGAPNLIDVEQWISDTAAHAQHLLTDHRAALAFLARLLEASHMEGLSIGEQIGLSKKTVTNFRAATEASAKIGRLRAGTGHEESDSVISHVAEKFEDSFHRVNQGGMLESLDAEAFHELPLLNKVMHSLELMLFTLKERLRKAKRTLDAIHSSPVAGPGRDDAWGLVERVVMEDDGAKLGAPICVPPLFGNADYDWYHCDGNTNSVMDRNLAQGIALGADVLPDGKTTTLLPRAINRMDVILRKIHPPKWPKELPEIDEKRRARGEKLFRHHPIELKNGQTASCASCHDSTSGRSYPIDLIGTNPNRWETFNNEQNKGPKRLEALVERIKEIRDATYSANGISPEEGMSWEINGTPEWRATEGYLARDLAGIWASPPYLHNGSVRSLYQLLLPEEEREKTFHVGSRMFDTKEVGYVNEPGTLGFQLDTSVEPNTNVGHDFGRDLTEDQRLDLVEYLKSL